MTDQKVIKREETDPAYTWAVEDLYKKEADWEAEYALLSSRIPEMESFRGHLGTDAQTLLHMQKTSDSLNMLAERIYVYANQRLHEDTDNGHFQNLANRAQGLLVRLGEACSYVEPELLALP